MHSHLDALQAMGPVNLRRGPRDFHSVAKQSKLRFIISPKCFHSNGQSLSLSLACFENTIIRSGGVMLGGGCGDGHTHPGVRVHPKEAVLSTASTHQ